MKSTRLLFLALSALPLFAQAGSGLTVIAHEAFVGNSGMGPLSRFSSGALGGEASIGDDGRVAYGTQDSVSGSVANKIRTFDPATKSTFESLLPARYFAQSSVVMPGGPTISGVNEGGGAFDPNDLFRGNAASAVALNAGFASTATLSVWAATSSGVLVSERFSGQTNSTTYLYSPATGMKTVLFKGGNPGDPYTAVGQAGVGPNGQFAAGVNVANGGVGSIVRRNADGTITNITNVGTQLYSNLYGVNDHAVDALGNVVYGAKANVSGRDGIYLSNGVGAPTLIASTLSAQFDAVTATGVGGPRIDSSGRVVFAATSTLGKRGLYAWSLGTITKLVEEGDAILDLDGQTISLNAFNGNESYPSIFSLNARGDVLIGGRFLNAAGNSSALGLAVLAAPVPEPASFAALAVGAVAVFGRRRRR